MKKSSTLSSTHSIDWKFQKELVDYEEALRCMDCSVKAIQKNERLECIWLLEHPPLYTIGTRGTEEDIHPLANYPIFQTGRGGQVTYHGPGQRIIYVMLNLNHRYLDLHRYVRELEEWILQALILFGVNGLRRKGRVGIWVQKEQQDYKIAAIGIRIQKWVTSHGIALNVDPDLTAYHPIVPCGLKEYGITSLGDLGLSITLEEIDEVLKITCPF